MSTLGMPSVNITFTEKAAQSIQRSERGIVGIVIKESAATITDVGEQFDVYDVSDIPTELSSDNKMQITLALSGYSNSPRKIVVFTMDSEDIDYTEVLKKVEVIKIDYLVFTTISTDSNTTEVVTWIKTQREAGNKIKAVLPNVSADHEGVISVADTTLKIGITDYTTEQICTRVAGILASTPLTISATYAPIPEAVDCTKYTKQQLDTMVGSGKFVIFWDGEKVKCGRAVNSLTTVTQDKGDQFKKIKIVECMDMIYDDIKQTAEDSYLGKFANSYDNKCLLISAISSYFETLKLDGIVSSYSVGIDIDTQRVYLKSQGKDVNAMSEQEIKEANTGSKVFIKATVAILDSIEEIELPISLA